MSALSYFLTITEWTIHQLQELDREVRRILTDNKARHPCASVPLLYLPRVQGGRGLKSAEQEYKEVRIKTAIHLYASSDPAVKAAALTDQARRTRGRRSIMKDAEKYAEEMGVEIYTGENLEWSITHVSEDGCEKVVTDETKIKPLLRDVRKKVLRKEIESQQWLGRYTNERWEMGYGSDGFPWLNGWNGCPTDVVADMEEIVQQLIPTRIYYSVKLGQDITSNLCRLCGLKQETVSHLLSGCERLSQTEYLYRHNNVLKCLYFELLKQFGVIKTVPPLNSVIEPKPLTKTKDVEILWDIPILSSGSQVLTSTEQGNRPDMVLINKKEKMVTVIECSCPLNRNMERKDVEKTSKYQEVRIELKRRFPEYAVNQINLLLDVMGGYQKSLKESLSVLLGQDKLEIAALKKKQKAAIFGSGRIKNLFKSSRF